MARRKKTKKSGLKSFFSKKKKKSKRGKRKNPDTFAGGLKVVLSIMFLTILVAGGAIGLIYMDRYVKDAAKAEAGDGVLETKEGPVTIEAPPAWLNNNQDWEDWIVDVLGSATFPLNEASAGEVSGKLSAVTWFKSVRVQTKPDGITVQAEYRRPVGWVTFKKDTVYVGDDMMIMNYIPMTPAAPVIEIDGTSSNAPEPGQVWQADDAEAAVELLDLLYQADLHFIQKNKIDKPLLSEIASVNVSNFSARRSNRRPNIVLMVKDGTELHWGAALGKATVYMEAPEKTKLLRLYEYFMNYNNTLQGTAKTIDLRWLEDGVPRPQ